MKDGISRALNSAFMDAIRHELEKPLFVWAGRVAIVVVLLAAFALRVGQQIDTAPPEKDGVHYLTMAHNLLNHGVLALESGPPVLEPTAYRPPGYPAFLTAILFLTGNGMDTPLDEFLQERQTAVKVIQSAIILLTGLLGAALVWQISGSALGAGLAFFGIACTTVLHNLSAQMQPEPLATFLVTIQAAAFYKAMQTRHFGWFLLIAVVGGVLAITRSAFLYQIPLLVLFFAYAGYVTKDWRNLVSGALVSIVLVAVTTGAWMLRNYNHFDQAFLTQRGGLALIHRAEFNRMTAAEYWASFCYFSNCAPLRSMLSFFDQEDYRRLNWQEPDGYYNTARERRNSARALAQMDTTRTQYATTIDADATLKKEGFQELFIDHPFKHIAVTLPMVHRSLYLHSCLLSLGIFFGAAYMLIQGFREKRMDWLGLLVPFVFTFSFTGFLTYAIPRHNVPIVPILWIAAGVALAAALAKMFPRKPEGEATR